MPRAGLTPERIVAEAADLADEVGVEQLTLAAVAQRLGVAVPSLYKHIGGLDDVRRQLAVMGVRELRATLATAAMGRARGQALSAVSSAYRQFARRRPGLYSATLRAPAPGDDEHGAASAQLLEVAMAVMASYGIGGSDAVHAIRIYRSALHGFVTQEASGAWAMAESVDDTYELMVRLLDGALTHWSTSA